jgi:hypothetical protein
MKPGYKSTEFWLAALAQVVALFLNAGAFPDTHWAVKLAALVAAGLAAAGYSVARGSAKAAEVTTVAAPPVVAPAKATLSTKKGALVDTLK